MPIDQSQALLVRAPLQCRAECVDSITEVIALSEREACAGTGTWLERRPSIGSSLCFPTFLGWRATAEPCGSRDLAQNFGAFTRVRLTTTTASTRPAISFSDAQLRRFNLINFQVNTYLVSIICPRGIPPIRWTTRSDAAQNGPALTRQSLSLEEPLDLTEDLAHPRRGEPRNSTRVAIAALYPRTATAQPLTSSLPSTLLLLLVSHLCRCLLPRCSHA